MRDLFDQGVPVPLRSAFVGHEVATAYELRWSRLRNGESLEQAETRFDILITTDQSLPYQQNLSGRQLAVFVLPTTDWRTLSRTRIILRRTHYPCHLARIENTNFLRNNRRSSENIRLRKCNILVLAT